MVSEGVVGLHDVVETESMRDESCGTKLTSLHQFEQQWRRDGVDQARGERDVPVPQFLEVQLHGLAMDANVRDASARAHNGLAGVERRRRADRLDRQVHSRALGDRQHPRHGIFSGAIHDWRGAEFLRSFETIGVEVDHQNGAGGVQLRGEQSREADRSGADDRDGVTRLDLAIQDTTFVRGRQNVAEEYDRFQI